MPKLVGDYKGDIVLPFLFFIQTDEKRADTDNLVLLKNTLLFGITNRELFARLERLVNSGKVNVRG